MGKHNYLLITHFTKKYLGVFEVVEFL